MYRIRYELMRHYKDIDNYNCYSNEDSDFIYGDTIEILKEKCIDFTILNNYDEKLSKIIEYKNNGYEYLDEWVSISFSNIEKISESIKFDIDVELKNSKVYKEIILNGERYMKKRKKLNKIKKLEHAKKQYENLKIKLEKEGK